jgi:hypothetical protein
MNPDPTCPQIGKKLGLRLPNRRMHSRHDVSSENSGKRLMPVNGLRGILLHSGCTAIPASILETSPQCLVSARKSAAKCFFRSRTSRQIDGIGVMFHWRFCGARPKVRAKTPTRSRNWQQASAATVPRSPRRWATTVAGGHRCEQRRSRRIPPPEQALNCGALPLWRFTSRHPRRWATAAAVPFSL